VESDIVYGALFHDKKKQMLCMQ